MTGPPRAQLLANRDKPKFTTAFRLATDRRNAEELYDTQSDPHCLTDLAADPDHAQVKARLANQLQTWMSETGDRRAAHPRTRYWDNAEYYGPS